MSTWPDAQPISTLPQGDNNLMVLVFGDYTDELKRWELESVGWVNICTQYTYWMPSPPLPKALNPWCECDDCKELKDKYEQT